MKKLLALILCCIIAFGVCFAETDSAAMEEAEEGILMHGYIDPYTKYYIGVPAEWALIGPGSVPENLQQARGIPGIDADAIYATVNEANPTLYALSENGEGLIVTYGKSEGVSTDSLISNLGQIKEGLLKQYPNVVFDENSGSYDLNSYSQILYVGMEYNNYYKIYQYYIAAGGRVYVFTFLGKTAEMKQLSQTIMTTFSFAND